MADVVQSHRVVVTQAGVGCHGWVALLVVNNLSAEDLLERIEQALGPHVVYRRDPKGEGYVDGVAGHKQYHARGPGNLRGPLPSLPA